MIPGLPQKTRATVFRLIVQRLRTDPVLKNVVKTWFVWGSDPFDASGQTLGLTPSIRLTPQLGPTGWYSPADHVGPLQVKVELLIGGFDADDCLNLWECIEEAFYPVGDRQGELDWEAALRAAGAETGQITFSQPASIQQADDAQFLCLGLMQLDVIRTLAP